MISTLEVKMGQEFIPLFRSAYSDLADVREAVLKTSATGFTLVLHGGETGTGYTARLRFQNGYLVERTVSHNEMGLEEKTAYYPVRDN